jgi:hypothetical protein
VIREDHNAKKSETVVTLLNCTTTTTYCCGDNETIGGRDGHQQECGHTARKVMECCMTIP